MFQRTLATVLMALLLVNATSQQESLVFSNSNLDTTEVGIAKSLLKLLVNTKEANYESVTGDTINSIAETYYGSSSFSLLLVRGNADIEFPSTSDVLTVGTKLRLPSVLLCPQFLGVDCLLTSYQKSLLLDDSTNNYWKNLPAQTLTRVEEFMSYPNYMTFIMSALTSQDLNPTLNLNIKISNYAHADLTNGTIIFTTGFGKTPEAVIPVNSVSNYHAQRSDLLHGIHGTLSYLIRDESGQEQSFSLSFHVYAGNGSIWNTFSFGDQVETGAPTSQSSGFRNLQIGSHLIAWSSITESPDVQINIVLESSTDPLTFNDELKVIKSNSTGKAFEGPYASFMVGYRSFIYRQNNEPWQNWRFVPLSDEWKHRNQFRISNDNSTFSLTADEAQSIILYEDADENNKNQIWSVIPLGNDLYQIRSSNGLCLHAAVDIVPRNPPAGSATTTAREVWLEACDAANVDQQWNIIDQTAWSYSR